MGNVTRGVAGWSAALVLLAAGPALAQDAAASPVTVAAAVEAGGHWQRAESAHFVVYSDGGERGLRDYVAKLEDFDATLRLFHGRGPEQDEARKLHIYLVRNVGQLKRVFPGVPDTVAGVYSSSVGDVFAVAIREAAGLDDATVMHEYVHHFMLQHHPGVYPAWLIEGYAEYFMTAEIEPKKITIGGFNPGRVSSLNYGLWIPAEDLLSKRPRDLPRRVGNYYAQSWLLTHYMIGEPGRRKQLGAYVAAVARGEEPVEAWKRVVGDTPDELDRKLKAYLHSAIPTKILPREAAPVFEMTVTRLPPSADDLILETQQARRGEDDKEAGARLLRTITADAARHPGDRMAVLALARVQADWGDRAVGLSALDAWLAGHPVDAEALRLAAETRLALARAEPARTDPVRSRALRAEALALLGRANKAEPDSYQTLFAFAQARSDEPGYPSDNTLNVLERAFTLAPQVQDIRLATAQALAMRGYYPEAIGLLEPIANSPHGGKVSDKADELLKAWREKAATPAAKP